MRNSTIASLGAFRNAGAAVEEVSLGWTAEYVETAFTHLSFGMGGLLLRDFGASEARDQLTPYIQSFLENTTVSRDEYLLANDRLNEMYATRCGARTP